MVKIINGEIVQDDDPRLKNRKPGNVPITPNNPRFGQTRSSESVQPEQPPAGAAPANPLDMVASALGIADKFITVPAIQPLGFTETRLPLIYIIFVGLLCLIFGARSLLFAVFVYVMIKHSERQA
jgi:hypothetical protein